MDIFENFSFQDKKIRVYGTVEEPLFLLKNVAEVFNIASINSHIQDFDESEKLLEKAKTIEEIEDIIKEELSTYRDGVDEYWETLGIFVTEIKNPDILEGLVHLPENSFSCDDDVESRIKELKSDENFKEALELSESFNKLKDLINDKGPGQYQGILEKHSS